MRHHFVIHIFRVIKSLHYLHPCWMWTVRKLTVITLQPGAEARVQVQVPDDKLPSQLPRAEADDLFGNIASFLWLGMASPMLHALVAINCEES